MATHREHQRRLERAIAQRRFDLGGDVGGDEVVGEPSHLVADRGQRSIVVEVGVERHERVLASLLELCRGVITIPLGAGCRGTGLLPMVVPPEEAKNMGMATDAQDSLADDRPLLPGQCHPLH